MNNYNTELIFKWLKSENASSTETKKLARKTREAFNITAREYRKLLSYGREKTKVLERLMSANEWDKIDFSKIPSKAGLIYKNAFARRDILAKKYEHLSFVVWSNSFDSVILLSRDARRLPSTITPSMVIIPGSS